MSITRRERVAAAINHRQADRPPRGELAIEDGLVRALLGYEVYESSSPRERLLRVWQELGADLVTVHQFPMSRVDEDASGQPVFRSVLGDEHVITPRSSHLHRPAFADIADAADYEVPSAATILTDELDWFVAHSDLFTFAQVMGPISSLDWMLGTEDYMVWALTDTAAIRELSAKVMEYETARAHAFVDHGADGIMVTDDIAFNSGLFLPPRIMDELAWPFYRALVAAIKAHRDVPVFLHSDGDIRAALPRIVGCGFDGLHSLQPSAGMDIEAVKRDHGGRLCLMGNLDLNHLLPFGSPEQVAAEAGRLCETIGAGGGYILATCNILTDAVPVENVRSMYGA
jgi:uroporphyrinogen decarboxylase